MIGETLDDRKLSMDTCESHQGKYRLSKFPLDSYLGLPPEAPAS